MFTSIPPVLRALLAQLLTLLLLNYLLPLSDLRLWLQGGAAALLGSLLRLPWWWLPINLLFPIILHTVHDAGLPPWWFLLIFIILLLFNWNSATGRIPLYLSNRQTWQTLAEVLPSQTRMRVVDLGSGLGGTLLYLARQHPQHRFIGIESAPIPLLISQFRLRLAGLENLAFHRGNFWDEDLGEYDLVYAFLSTEPMPRLYEKFQREARYGTQLISNSFDVPEHPAPQRIEVADNRRTQLLCWQQNEQGRR